MPVTQRIGFAGLLIGLALLLPASAMAGTAAKVTVIGQDNQILGVFKTAKCKTRTPKGVGTSFLSRSVSTNGRYELEAKIFQPVFHGFGKYDLTLDPDARAVLYFQAIGGGPIFSNEFVPPYSVPGFGQINFSKSGKHVGLGFGPAMWSQDFSDAVVLAGGLECRYATKPKA
jgi:hypothetical protein